MIELTQFPDVRFNYIFVTHWPLEDLEEVKKALSEDARNCGVTDFDFFHRAATPDDDVDIVGWYERNE